MKKITFKVISVFMAILMITTSLPFVVFAEENIVINVGSTGDLAAAKEQIQNDASDAKYTVIFTDDIADTSLFYDANHEITFDGQGHTLLLGGGESKALSLYGGTVSICNLVIDGQSIQRNDTPGAIYVNNANAVLNINEGTVIKNYFSNNYAGGGLTVQSGLVNMNGGTIENCAINGGSFCVGGGVAVLCGGRFIMNGGEITGCHAYSSYNNSWQIPAGAGGGVAVFGGSEFIMNGGTISNCYAKDGGGVVVISARQSVVNKGAYGYLDSEFVMNGGTITGCEGVVGGGVAALGTYVESYALAAPNPTSGIPEQQGVFINGGTISGNTASNGGGVFLHWLHPTIPAQIHNATIKDNYAYDGAGINVFHRWTQADIDGCTITGNYGETGGGISLLQNTQSAGTTIKNCTITDNTADIIGAGVYYDESSKIKISGANYIQDNKTIDGKLNNLNVLDEDHRVEIIGDLTGSEIGITDPVLWNDGLEDNDWSAVSANWLTVGYNATNPEYPDNDPAQYFTSDHETWIPYYGDIIDPIYGYDWTSENWTSRTGIVYNDYVRTSDFANQNLKYSPDNNTIYASSETPENVTCYPLSYLWYTDAPCCYLAYKNSGKYYVICEMTGTTNNSRTWAISGLNMSEKIESSNKMLGCGTITNKVSKPENVLENKMTIVSPGIDYSSEVHLVRAFKVTYTDGVENETVFDDQVSLVHFEEPAPAFVGGTPKRKGYIFKGWDSEISTCVTSNLTYTAMWEPEPCTIKYVDGADGTVFEEVTIDTFYDEVTPAFGADPERVGYTFAGWSPEVAPIVKGDATYTAQWNPKPYTVTYNDGVDNEEVFPDKVIPVYYDEATPAFGADPERPGYTFEGWSPEVAETVTGDAVYKAQWTPIPYTITYTDGVNDEEVFADKVSTAYYGDTTPAFGSDPERVGYTFAGWLPVVAQTVTGDATYVAQWTVDNYTVTYNDGVEGQEVFADQVYHVDFGMNTPAFNGKPIRTGYEFIGWTPVVSETVTGNVTYYATWKILYTVVYTDGVRDVNIFDDVFYLVPEGDETPTYTPPKRRCYEFTGWSPVVADTVTENVVYKATWKPIDTEHEFTEWEVVIQPTCLQKGLEKHHCIHCGKEETRELSITDHIDVDGDGFCDICAVLLIGMAIIAKQPGKCKDCSYYYKHRNDPVTGFMVRVVHFFIHLGYEIGHPS